MTKHTLNPNELHEQQMDRLTRVGVAITNLVGTMWCAILFAVLALVSLPAAATSGSLVVIVGWIAQTFLQLVLLSIIMVGQNAQAEHSQIKAEQDHEVLTSLHRMMTEHLEGHHQRQAVTEALYAGRYDEAPRP